MTEAQEPGTYLGDSQAVILIYRVCDKLSVRQVEWFRPTAWYQGAMTGGLEAVRSYSLVIPSR